MTPLWINSDEAVDRFEINIYLTKNPCHFNNGQVFWLIMPYTDAVSFDKFRENIELMSDHRETAKKRRDNIVSILSKDFEIIDAFPSGSIPRFTAITGYADLDVIVVYIMGSI